MATNSSRARRGAQPEIEDPAPVTRKTVGAIIGDARPFDLSDKKEAERFRKRRDGWQKQAWDYFDSIGEIHFAFEFFANAVGKVNVFAAWKPTPDSDPIRIDPEDPDVVAAGLADVASIAIEAVGRVQSQMGGTPAVMSDLGMNLGIAGEGWVIAREIDGKEDWTVYSGEQLIAPKTEGGVWHARDEPNDKNGYPLENVVGSWRFWRAHRRFRGLADSSMKSVLEPCEELLLLSRAIRSTAVSRLAGNGIVLFPDTLMTGTAELTGDSADENTENTDEFVEQWVKATIAPIEDPGSASAVVPFPMWGPKEDLEAVRHLTFDRELDSTQAGQRQELLGRIANGLDLPAQMILGLGDSNHWSAWLIDQQTFEQHIEPTVRLIVNSWTSAMLRPALDGIENGDKVFVWFSADDLVATPEEAKNANDAIKVGAIGYETYRRALGFTDDDAPSEEDLALFEKLGVVGTKPGGWANSEGGRTPGTSEGETDPAPAVAASAVWESPVLALVAAGAPIGRLGAELAGIDRALRTKIQQAADDAVNTILNRLGARLRRKARGDHATRIKTLSNEAVPRYMIASGIIAAGEATDDVEIEAGIQKIHDKFMGWTAAQQKQVRKLAQRHGLAFAPGEQDQLEARQDEDRRAAWVALAAALAIIVHARIADPSPKVPLEGEFDAHATVPAGVVRAVLSIAGGDRGTVTTHGLLDPASLTPEPAGGLATGVTALDLFRSAGVVEVASKRWVYGDASTRTRPFEPHENLDGIEFATWTDDVLTNDEDYPDTPYFFPGDHLYCQCDFEPIFEDAAQNDDTGADE